MPELKVNGLRTNYQLLPGAVGPDPWRANETVVFIHGMGTDSLASFYLTLAPPVAAAGIDVISYDLRGHGRSERPVSGYALADFVADLDELLCALTVTHPVHLVGNSFGGTIAYAYAAAHPYRVRSVVAIESEPPTEIWAAKMAGILAATTRMLGVEENYEWIEATFGAHHRRLARLAAARFTATTMADEVATGPMMTAPEVAAITCPVLSILGRHGYQADDLDAVTASLPGGEAFVFEDQGHSVLVERHRAVRGLLVEWVRRHGGG
ncbi:alpha/beta fold hydrolase [Actinokineospora cianjurensis]|uniref:Alpha-beta hydrolase superfamily lysophospholipase n=1 Tax=Actinokineospora cianjurensis TaxID=585224 RepID=A0A421B2S2_9PSEU|nr:alpha/beta hydrolase [Actinokineospora cianjurensis]RLK58677.1 alpha-beta hydrolase superfamily lysophospholipase [Actinokineospora cianjurensis]